MVNTNLNKHRESIGRWCIRMSGIIVIAIIIIQLISGILSTNTIRNSVLTFNQYFRPLFANGSNEAILPSISINNSFYKTTIHVTRGIDEKKVVENAVKNSNISLISGNKKLCSLMPANLS